MLSVIGVQRQQLTSLRMDAGAGASADTDVLAADISESACQKIMMHKLLGRHRQIQTQGQRGCQPTW